MHTLAHAHRVELEVRKSRFLAHAAPVGDADAALAFVREASDPAATHNCWAFRVGAAYRSSDDGEPAGTAGRPILAAIDGQRIDRAVVVVTRWYGGIKLGAGGLARAYGGCAAECLRTAARVAIVALARIAVRCEFAALGALHGLLDAHGARKLDERFDERGACVELELPADQVAAFAAALRDATRGSAAVDVMPA